MRSAKTSIGGAGAGFGERKTVFSGSVSVPVSCEYGGGSKIECGSPVGKILKPKKHPIPEPQSPNS